MGKIVEFEDVYLEYPDEEILTDESKENEENEKDEPSLEEMDNQAKEFVTTRLSLEELQQKLEETQSLHL